MVAKRQKSQNQKVDFGFQRIPRQEKGAAVRQVFDSVANDYDAMNDVMSFFLHRVWKNFALSCGLMRDQMQVLDVASGTCDLVCRLKKRYQGSQITALDINQTMLNHGRSKLMDHGLYKGIHYVCADAEHLPFATASFDRVTLAFGLRNMTDKHKALIELYRICKPLGKIVILEFSKPTTRTLAALYQLYSFQVIPKLGQMIAGDRGSYQYLVESIAQHPSQKQLLAMLVKAGFSNATYINLLGGIVAIHIGYKCT
jgi:demethylmenaquinone methyltransferase / 2-methoxy-6-polyprenyl-1,4-benzoquinol methylase